MLAFPNCKINLGLNITGKRADGYHNIETIFYPVQLNDVLEIIESPAGVDVNFSASGNPVDGDEKDNLCIKAFYLLKKDFPQLPSVKIHLHKTIPMGAGLGGGSSDAAFALVMLNKKFSLKLSAEQLLSYALALGSDCPFFIINQPCVATGRGEIMEPVNISLTGYYLVLVNPGIHINTGWAFGQLNNMVNGHLATTSLQTDILQPINCWKDNLVNDFEEPVFEKYPAIKMIKTTLYNNGALFAGMSGSGSTVFGIYDKKICITDLPVNYYIRTVLL
ncbi:MAG: 4-(cytidine 5'-diphospho)-2-C-methyl-D-erythritol kinase [Aquabacterium sp.]|nr:4-(cytidine 5'-diphospho)-2-C-methyl-D-erythritol kinase [Ferruginibacter sp.]